MLSVAARTVFVCCILVHTGLLMNNIYLLYVLYTIQRSVYFVVQGVAFLFYPLIGWMADIHFTRYKTMKYSFLVIAFGSLLLLSATIPCIVNSELLRSWPLVGIAGLAVILQIIGLGMFEANAIQFGMDQLLEASSSQLSTFIHWYFWALHVGSLIMFYLALACFGFLTT